MPPKKKSKTKSAGAARTKLLWPRKGEWVLACAHAFGTNDVDVYAFVRPARVKYRFGDSVACRQAHYFVLCRPCVKRLADGVPQRELLTDAGAWSNPDPIEIPTEPLPVSGLN